MRRREPCRGIRRGVAHSPCSADRPQSNSWGRRIASQLSFQRSAAHRMATVSIRPQAHHSPIAQTPRVPLDRVPLEYPSAHLQSLVTQRRRAILCRSAAQCSPLHLFPAVSLALLLPAAGARGASIVHAHGTGRRLGGGGLAALAKEAARASPGNAVARCLRRCCEPADRSEERACTGRTSRRKTRPRNPLRASRTCASSTRSRRSRPCRT